MTKVEAAELENICDKLMSYYTKEECTVSLALSGKLKVEFVDGDYINVNRKTGMVDYVNFRGCYDDLLTHINNIRECLNDNKRLFNDLVWSYEHISELT